jgi:uncharacterized membrane protein
MAGAASVGLPKSRVEALSDGVFSIAMTVLVLNIQVPEGGSAEELAHKLAVLWPKLLTYATSFVMLGVPGSTTISSSTTSARPIARCCG